MARCAEMLIFEVWYDCIEVDDLLEQFEDTEATKKVKKNLGTDAPPYFK